MDIYCIVDVLECIIEQNGLLFLDNEPYQTYLLLIDKGISKKDASIVLLALLNGILKVKNNSHLNHYEWSEKECCLVEDKAKAITNIFSNLCSNENMKRWKGKEFSGLKQFMETDFEINWHGFAVWDEGNGTIDCHYDASFIIHPKKDFN